MKNTSKLSILVLALMVFGLLTTSCKKDEDETITITETNIIGTWENTEKNITLIIDENNVGVYESDYYSNPPKAISWSITSSNQLDVSDGGTFAQTYQMNNETTLEDVWGATILTKK